MIRLPNAGTYSLELVTAQNGAQVVVCYSDATSSTYIGGTQATAIVSATTTAICATPAASTVRDVDQINIKNTFAGSHTITVQLDVAATNVPIITAALLTDESLNYTHGSGWQQKDANGNTKTNPIGFVMTSAQLAAIVSDETGTGALVFANSPTLVTPALGTPSAVVLTNATGLPATSVINTPAGNIAATTVQDALNELDSEKAKVGALASSGITGAAASGANTDITSMTALTAPTVAANPVRATDLQVQLATAFTTAGTSTAFTLTPAPAITANAANQRFRVKFNAAAGTTPTLAVSGQAALALKYRDSTGAKQAITSTQVPINWVSDVENDGTDWVVLSVATQNKPAFSVYKTANQTGIANDTFTLVTWDAEEFDTDNSFASNRFTPKAAGNYLLNAHLMWTTGVDQSAYLISIYKNGSLYKATRHSFSGSTSSTGNLPSNQITEIVKANGTTDYFEIYVWQGSGSTQELAGNSSNSVFSGVLL